MFIYFMQIFTPMLNDLKVRKDVEKYKDHCHQKPFGKGSRSCERCASHRGFNRKFGINLCRRCLHNKASIIGFKTFD